MRRAGFSMIELVISMFIMTVVLLASVPNLRSYRESVRLQRGTDIVTSAVADARARSRSENISVIVECRTATNEVAVIDDSNGNGTVDVGERVEVHALGNGLTLAQTSFTNDHLIFDDRGTAISGGSIFVTGADGLPPKRCRVSTGTGHVTVRGVTAVGDEN